MSRSHIYGFHFTRLALLPFLLAVFVGCQRRDTSAKVTWEQEPTKYTLLIVADIEVVKSDPRSYDFVIHAIDRYASDRMGEHDQVIISQISGNDRPLLFQGTPRELRRAMPNHEEFRNYLIAHSDPGRRLHEGLAESFDYVLNTSSVSRGKAVPVTLIISSMKEGENEASASKERFINALIKYHQAGGQMAFYFCDQQRMAWVREQTAKAGMTWTLLEGNPNGHPPLPSFE